MEERGVVQECMRAELRRWYDEAKPPENSNKRDGIPPPVEVRERIQNVVNAQTGRTKNTSGGQLTGSDELVQAKRDFRERIKSHFGDSYIGKTSREHAMVAGIVQAVMQSVVGQKLSDEEKQMFVRGASRYVTASEQRKRGVNVPRTQTGYRHKRGQGVKATSGLGVKSQSEIVSHTRWTNPSTSTRENLTQVASTGPREATFRATYVGIPCSVLVKPELRKWTKRPAMLTPAPEQFLQSLDTIGNYYVGKTEKRTNSTTAVPWIVRATESLRRHMQSEDQLALMKACQATETSPLQLQLSYARIAAEEGVAAMEARVIDLKRNKPGSQNRAAGLASAGGEGWLYFWDVVDARFHR